MYYVKYLSHDILIVLTEKVLLDIDKYDLFSSIKKRYRSSTFPLTCPHWKWWSRKCWYFSPTMYYKDVFPVKKLGDNDGSGTDAFPFIQGVSHSQLPHPNQLLQARFFMSILIFMNI